MTRALQMKSATLADLQTERDRLRALKARTEYENAKKQTCTHDALRSASTGCRDAIGHVIARIQARAQDAISGEFEETRLHFLLSDAILDEVNGLDSELTRASSALPMIGERIYAGARPRDLLTVSQWADKYRWILTGTNAPGRWRTALTPYLKDIMDDLSEHSPVRQVTFMKSSGVGGSEALFNFMGYIMHHLQNKDTLLVVPTLELRDRSFNPRINKMLSESPVLKDMMTGASRDKSNRNDLFEYGAMARIIKAGANSADSLRSEHLPYAICDEVDAFPWNVGGEGDPMTLIENRQRTFSRAKTYLVSTPTVENQSRIALMYQRSDRRRYHVPCPHCNALQVLSFTAYEGLESSHGLKWRVALPDSDTGEVTGRVDQVIDAWYVCNACEQRIDEGHKTDMLANGRWIAEQPAIKLYRGYHINALYSPTGLGITWRNIAQKWLDVQTDTAEMIAFVNTYLGEVWKERGDEVAAHPLFARRETYEQDDLPLCLITAGVDVQGDRLEYTLVGWGELEECWTLDHVILPGNTLEIDVWDELSASLIANQVNIACVDSGYNTQMVYDFCDKRKWAIPTKGIGGSGRPLIEDERKRKQRARYRRKKGIGMEPVGTDQGKAILYSRLKQSKVGAGYIHFHNQPDVFTQDYFDQLTAEKQVTRIKGSRSFTEWVKIRARNEALDCLLLNLVAVRLWGKELKFIPKSVSAINSNQPTTFVPKTKPKTVGRGFGSDGWNL